MDAKLERVVELVHRRDELRQRRNALTQKLDAEIVRVEDELATLVQARDGTPETTARHPPAGQTEPVLVSAAATSKSHSGSITERLLTILSASPTAGTKFLARQLHGKDDRAAQNRIRSSLSFLRKTGRIKGKVGHLEVKTTA